MEEIDLEKIESGMVIERSTCEELIGIRRSDDAYRYQFELLKLAKHLQRELWNAGKQLTVTTCDAEIQILSHADSSEYNSNRFELALKSARAANRRLMAVDVGKLSGEHRKDHESSMIRQSRIISMLRTVPKTVEVSANVDNRPKFVFKRGSSESN